MEDNFLQEISNLLQKSNDLLQQSYEKLKLKDEIINKQSDELSTWNKIKQSDKWFDFAEAAKIMNYKRVGRNILLAIMRDHKVFRSNNEPYQEYIDRGFFKIIPIYIDHLDETILKPLVSSEGLDYMVKILKGEGYEPK